MSTIVITGSSGFVGKFAVDTLRKSGYKVIEIDFTNGYDLTKSNCLDLVESYDWIIHLASRSFVPQSFEQPQSFYNDNFLGTLTVLESARKKGAKVLYFSSYLYGVPQYLPVDEKHPLAPHNPYAQTKLICEKLCEGYHRDFGLDIMVFRPFNIYGEGQNNSFLIPSIVEQAKSGKIVLKDPRPKRDFIHVQDIVKAIEHTISNQFSGSQILNLGSGNSTSIEEIALIVAKFVNRKLSIEFTNEFRKGEVLDTVADITKAQQILNWTPTISLEAGLEKIINYVKSNNYDI